MGQEYYKILVEKICSLATEAAPGLKQLGVPGVTQDLPSDGVWSYDEIMQQYCSTLTTVADCCNDFVDWEVVSRLWSGAVVPLLRLPTQDFLLKVFGGGAITRRNLECYFDVRTNFLLLDQHIVEVEPQAVTQYMLRLFNACFTKVGGSSGRCRCATCMGQHAGQPLTSTPALRLLNLSIGSGQCIPTLGVAQAMVHAGHSISWTSVCFY
jgi:hypothetical protein